MKRSITVCLLASFVCALATAQKTSQPAGVSFTATPSSVASGSTTRLRVEIASTAFPTNTNIRDVSTKYLFLAAPPGGAMSMIRSWSSTAYYDHTPSTAGTWRYRVQIQRTENGQAVGDVVSADTYVSVLAPLSNLQLQSPAASATVNGDNGVTFTWTAFESTARYDFCLSKFDYLPCASNSDSILRGNLSSASVTLARTDLTGFTGIPLWWAVKVRRGTQQQTTAGRAVTINTTGPVPLQWTWTTRLTQEHFTAAGATLNQEQINRLTAATISLNSIFNSTTNRVYDNKKCNECHDGTSGQMAPKYRPTTSMSKSTAHRKNKTDGSTTSTYRWDNSSDAGVVRAFKNTWYDKPEILEKLFQKWLDMGAQ